MRRSFRAAGRLIALTLIEVVMAMAILAVVIVITFEGLTGSSRIDALGAVQDRMAEDARRIIAVMESDLSATGWHFADRIDVDGVASGPPDESPDQIVAYNEDTDEWDHGFIYRDADPGKAMAFEIDRTRHYYPFIMRQPDPGSADVSGTGAGINASLGWSAPSWSADRIQTDPADSAHAGVPKQRWNWGYTWRPDSLRGNSASAAGVRPGELTPEFLQPSLDFYFLRVAVAGWKADPGEQGPPVMSFPATAAIWRSGWSNASASSADLDADAATRDQLGVLYMQGWREDPVNPGLMIPRDTATQRYGRVIEGAYVVENADGTISVRPKWETMALRQPGDPAANGVPSNLRVYGYVLVPSRTGVGRLVRVVSGDIHDKREPNLPIDAGQEWPVDRGPGIERGNWVSMDAANGRALFVDEVLSDDVSAIRFDTRRHNGELSMNQIRVRIYMARRMVGVDGQDTLVRRLVETDLFMGTRNSSANIAADTEALGPAIAPAW